MRQIPRYGHWHAHNARLLFASCMPRRCTIHHPRRGAHFRPVPFPRLAAWHQGSMFCFGECGLSTFKDARCMVVRCEVDPSAFRGNRRGLFQTPWAPLGGFILSCSGKHDGNPRSVSWEALSSATRPLYKVQNGEASRFHHAFVDMDLGAGKCRRCGIGGHSNKGRYDAN